MLKLCKKLNIEKNPPCDIWKRKWLLTWDFKASICNNVIFFRMTFIHVDRGADLIIFSIPEHTPKSFLHLLTNLVLKTRVYFRHMHTRFVPGAHSFKGYIILEAHMNQITRGGHSIQVTDFDGLLHGQSTSKISKTVSERFIAWALMLEISVFKVSSIFVAHHTSLYRSYCVWVVASQVVYKDGLVLEWSKVQIPSL